MCTDRIDCTGRFSFFVFLCPIQGRVSGYFSPKQSQGFKPSAALLYPNRGQVAQDTYGEDHRATIFAGLAHFQGKDWNENA